MKRTRHKKIPGHYRSKSLLFILGAGLVSAVFLSVAAGIFVKQKEALGVLGKETVVAPTSTAKKAPTNTTVTPTAAKNPEPTGLAPTKTPADTGTSATPTPIAGEDVIARSPPCPASAHSNAVFHSLWDPVLRCHYDHEHGQNPFTSEEVATFPGFNLRALLGGVQVGHTNPSSPMENTHKHGGFKWQFTPVHPQNCDGFEGAANGVNASVIEYHGFGDYSVELEGRIHSSAALLRLCNSASPADYGYMYTVQFQDYGQRVVPYQGTVFPYPDNPVPAYNSGLGPYLSVDCIGNVQQCRSSRDLVVSRRLNAATNWTAKPNGSYNTAHPFGSKLFTLFFRARDIYQLFDWNDQTYPFTFIWLCSSDGGRTYNPSGCRYNNSTTQVHEIAGEIPPAWDNLAGFDTNPRIGRVTAVGYTSRFGDLSPQCSAPGGDCFPLRLVNAPVGRYGSVLFFTPGKGTNVGPYLPERDIYFCNGRLCTEYSTGAQPSGWIGPGN